MATNDKDLTGAAVEHLGLILKSLQTLTSHHAMLQKSHDTLAQVHKLHGMALKSAQFGGKTSAGDDLDKSHALLKAAHESARLSRVAHKAAHLAHAQSVTDGVEAIKKVLGGGPESASTEKVAKANYAPVEGRLNSPFDRLCKDSKSKPREFINSRNPLWSGR